MKAEIISIGTELLLGEITDTNASFLASQLPLLGIDLYFISIVGDNQQRLVKTLKQAWQRSDLIITTGGLGPTQDDITRESIAELLNEELKTDPQLLQWLREFFCHRKLDMPKNNIKQASLIPSAQALVNPRGTAPGWWVERDEHTIISMPGPPYEMQFMWANEVMPKLKQKTDSSIIISRTLKTFGLGEAKVDELVSPFLSSNNPTLGIYAKHDGIYLRITAKAKNEETAQNLINQLETEIRMILNDYIWGADSDTIESIIGKLLIQKGLSLSIMESDTGGLLTNTITNIPESSTFFKGGLISYSDEFKIAFGIDPMLTSQDESSSLELAEAMATKAREKLNSNIGIGIAGIMESTACTNKATGSIFICIDDGNVKHKFARNYPGQKHQIKQRAISSALFELRKILI